MLVMDLFLLPLIKMIGFVGLQIIHIVLTVGLLHYIVEVRDNTS